MNNKAEKFRSRFLQESFPQILSVRGEINILFNLLTEEDIDKLISGNVFFARTSSPSAIIQLVSVPACEQMRLITFEADYQKLFTPDEVVGILLHEIGHAFNPDKTKMEAEFAADNFAKGKGYAKHVISGLRGGLKKGLVGFEQASIDERITQMTGDRQSDM